MSQGLPYILGDSVELYIGTSFSESPSCEKSVGVISIGKLFSDVAGGGSFGVELLNTVPGRIMGLAISL
jgi:hypothetical protein